MFGKTFKARLAAAAMVLASSAVHAGPQVFFGSDPAAGGVFPTDAANPVLQAQAAFEAQVVVTKREAFTSSTPGFIGATGNSTALFGGAGNTLTQDVLPDSPPPVGARIVSGPAANGRFNTTGGNASGAWIQSDWDFTLNLTERVNAFAFFGTDFGDFGGKLSIELLDGGLRVADNVFLNTDGSDLAIGGDDGSLLFFGYAADELLFNRIVFTVTQSSTEPDTLGFDDLRVGNLREPTGTVPEPGSLTLAGLALFAAGWARRSKQAC